MLFTRESDYALRLLRNLNPEEPTSINSIAEKEFMTSGIAYKVARKLEKGGLISSIRGNSGGYVLCKDLNELSLFDVYQIMEPNAKINECLRPDRPCPLTSKEAPCSLHVELARIQDELDKQLKSRPLAQVIRGS